MVREEKPRRNKDINNFILRHFVSLKVEFQTKKDYNKQTNKSITKATTTKKQQLQNTNNKKMKLLKVIIIKFYTRFLYERQLKPLSFSFVDIFGAKYT